MMRTMTAAAHFAVALVVCSVLLVAAGCGDDSDSDSAGASGAVTTGAVDASGNITLIAKDKSGTQNSFEPNTFTAKAGQKTTVTLENKGSVPHNCQVIGQKGPDGQDIKTALVN